jgi:MarR family transcriptional regulator, organic hydroperoxide resistance regulator
MRTVTRAPNESVQMRMRSVPRSKIPGNGQNRPSGRGRQREAEDLPFEASVGYQVRMTNRAFQTRLKDSVEPFGVSPGMWYLLRLLWQSDGLTQRELSRGIGIMDPTAFTALTNMERRGFVTRVKDPTDARKSNVFLTERGKTLREQMLPLARGINAEGLRGLKKAEIALLLRLLKRIEANLMAHHEGRAD